MRRRRSGTVKVVEMASINRLPKRRQRSSSSTISLENHDEEDERVNLQCDMDLDDKDLNLVAQNKRMRSVISLHVCATGEEGQESVRTDGDGDGEFEVELGEVTRELVGKSSPEILNPNQRGLRSRQLLVSKTSNCVIGAPVLRKARSACVKRSLQEYSAACCYNDQPHSNLEAGENGEKNGECKSAVWKGSKLSSSVDEDIEMEVAEVLFSLMNQSRRPENVSDSQQNLGVSLVKESEQINREIKLWSGKTNPEHVDKTGSSELKLLENCKVPVGMENAETAIVDEGLEEESKKEKSLWQTSLSIESGNSVYSKENQMAPFAGYQEGKLEIDFVGTKERTQKLLPEVTIGKPEKSMTEMGSLGVPVFDTSLQLEQLNWSMGATRSAQGNLSDSFPVSNDSCQANCSMDHLQPRDSIDKATGPFMASQPRMVYQHGRKRCSTHYYIARSIMYHHQCNLLSSKARSACSNMNGSFKKYVSEKQPQGLASKSSIVTNSASPQGKEAATGASSSCLPDSAQRTQHLNHKAPQVSSSEKTEYHLVGSKAELSGTHVSNSSPKTASPMKNASVTTCSSFSTMDPYMRLYNSQQVTNEGPPFMTIIPSNDYTLPISTSIGNSASYKGRVHGKVMPYLNGSVCPPQMFYPPLLSQQPTHPQTQILPSGRINTGLSGSSSFDKQSLGMQQHGIYVGGHTVVQSVAMRSPYPQKNHIPSFCHSHKPEAETPDRISICRDQRIDDNQHSQVPLQQTHFTMTPMTARNDNARKFKKQEFVQGYKVDFEPPAAQLASLSYSPTERSSLPSELSFSLPGQNFPFLPNLEDLAHRRNFDSKAAGVVYKKYQVEAKAGIDITGADSARKCFTGNPKEIPYDQTALVKGCSIFDNSGKTLQLYTAFESAKSQSHYGVQQHYAQGIWNSTSTTNSQPSSAVPTNMPYSPLVMSHPAHWSSKGSSQCTQSASTIPSFSHNLPPQLVPQSFTYGGNTEKSIPAQGNGMAVVHPPILANNGHTPSPNSFQSSSIGRKSGSAVLPACEPNEAGSNSSSQLKLSSPVCRIVVPSILSTRASQISEVKN